MLSDKALEGIAGHTAAFEPDQVPTLARETLRLRKEAKRTRKFLDARGLWQAYQEEARASPAGRPAGKKAGKAAGAAV